MATAKKGNSNAGKKKPGIDQNVWSRFDDDGYGIHNVRPTKDAQVKKGSTAKKKK